jgi:hypothetical protein
MPLKKPKNVPKIPKARSKSMEKLKDSTPMDKEPELEYVCKIYFYFDPQKKIQMYAAALETVKYFSMLNYELSLASKKNKKELDISILGLKTKQAYLVQPSPAIGEQLFEDLYGEYTINIIKKDGSINSAVIDFNVYKKEIKIIKEFLPEKINNRKFCEFKISTENFTFPKEGIL